MHHHIGVSESKYEHIGTFLRLRAGDPAIRVRAYFVFKGLLRDLRRLELSSEASAAHPISCS
jgi:hypothetical protein